MTSRKSIESHHFDVQPYLTKTQIAADPLFECPPFPWSALLFVNYANIELNLLA